jgi:cytochrome P450
MTRIEESSMSARQRIVGFDDPAFDSIRAFGEKVGSEVIKNPYPKFAEMRKQGAIVEGDFRTPFGLPPDSTLADMTHYTVLGNAEVAQVMGDQANFGNSIYLRNLGKGFGRSVTTMDPPEHPRFRRLFQKAFTPVALAKWGKDVVTPVVNHFVDQLAGKGKAELIGEFTIHYPFRFIYGQLALPSEDVDTFQRLAMALTCISNYPAEGMEASRKLGDYFELLVNERRDSAADDLISNLATAEIDGKRLPDDVIVSFLRQLMNAGGDTTYRGTSNLLVGLLTNPDQYKAVCENRALLPQAIEEGMRWEAPVVSVQRTPTRDIEVAGVMLPAGSALVVVVGAANRDSALYANADSYDLTRKQQRHSAFGYGAHVCIGQHLARLEMTVAMNAPMDRLHNLRLDPGYPVPQVCGLALRAPAAVHAVYN